MNIANYLKEMFFSCGVSNDQFKSVRNMAYKSNYHAWKYLNILLTVFFTAMIIITLSTPYKRGNLDAYVIGAIVSGIITLLFFLVLKEDSVVAQVLIYINLALILLLGIMLSIDSSNMMSVTFIAILLAMPIFVINRPCLLALVILISGTAHVFASITFKDPATNQGDLVNTIIFGILSVVISCIYSSIRVKEFLLIKQIENERDTDGLTGLKNKDALMRNITEFVASRHNKGVFLAIDIDDFKSINDNYGHIAGDVVLATFGKILSSHTSKNDICGRFGGDEFIILYNNKSLDEATDIAKAMIDDIGKNVRTPNKNDRVTFSVGLAEFSGEEKDYDDIFKKADMALYQAKAAGKNQYKVYE